MTIEDVQKWRIEAVGRYRADSKEATNHPSLRDWAQGRAQLADEIEAMTDADLILRIEADERFIDKMTSGVST